MRSQFAWKGDSLRVTIIVAGFLLSSVITQAQSADAALQIGLQGIRAQSIRASMEFLADDLMEGREAGTRGYDVAAAYVASQFEKYGLQPGLKDSYYQTVPFRRGLNVNEECSMAIYRGPAKQSLVYGKDYYLSPNLVRADTSVEAEAVFVGFGVTAPELGRDDYAGVDVRGKLAVMIKGGPSSFPNDQRAYYSSGFVKASNAAAHGAIGIISVRLPSDEKRASWQRITSRLNETAMHWVHKDEIGGTVPEIKVQAGVSSSVAAKIFAGSGESAGKVLRRAESGQTRSFPLKGRFRIHQRTRLDTVPSRNVVALLRGSDPRLSDEYVVFTAHLDHEGMDVPEKGDRVFNGAFDNASGIAAMLEVARALQSLPVRSARSLLFIALTGEEKGLQGADFFAKYPTVPIEQIVADVNLDMFVALFPITDVVAFGAGHSTLGKVVEDAAKKVGWKLSEDPWPEEVIFIRSDQYPFVRQRVPSVFIVNGQKSGDPSVDGEKVIRTWMRDVYHTRRDDLSQNIEYDSLVKFARLNLLIGWDIAQNPERPAWNEGNFFGKDLPF